jgi:hypothetical protein
MKHFLFSTAAPIGILLASCVAPDLPTPAEVQVKISAAVPVGSSKATVDAALKAIGMTATFDRLLQRYQGIIRSQKTDRHAILFYVYLDSQGLVSKVEAVDSFTSL